MGQRFRFRGDEYEVPELDDYTWGEIKAFEEMVGYPRELWSMTVASQFGYWLALHAGGAEIAWPDMDAIRPRELEHLDDAQAGAGGDDVPPGPAAAGSSADGSGSPPRSPSTSTSGTG